MGKELNNFVLGVHMWSTRWKFNNFLLWIHMWYIKWEFNKKFIRNTYTIYKVHIDCSPLIVLNKLTTQHPIQITTQSTKYFEGCGTLPFCSSMHICLFVCFFNIESICLVQSGYISHNSLLNLMLKLVCGIPRKQRFGQGVVVVHAVCWPPNIILFTTFLKGVPTFPSPSASKPHIHGWSGG
jgi:hypothetical protein